MGSRTEKISDDHYVVESVPYEEATGYLVVDLDGTICEQTYNNTYHLAKPHTEVIKKLWELYEAGWYVTIFTARGMRTCKRDVVEVEKRYREMTEEWLMLNQVPYDELLFGKPPGDHYVDDRGIDPEEFSVLDIEDLYTGN